MNWKLRASGRTFSTVAPDDCVVADHQVRIHRGRRVVAQVPFKAARVVGFLRLRVIKVEDVGERVAGLPLQRGHGSVAHILAHVRADLHAVRHDHSRGNAGVEIKIVHGPAVTVPRLVSADAFSGQRLVEAGVAEGDAEFVVGELIDVGEAGAIALVGGVGAEIVVRIALAADVEDDRAPAVVERALRPQIDGARETLADELRIGRLVDDDRAQQFGRVLVELDAAVVTGTHLLAPVEQCAGEGRIGAAQADCRGAAVGALRSEARQARDRLRDAGVGQLADVLGRDDFDDAAGVLLFFGGGLDGVADAADHHFLDRAFVFGGRGIGRGLLGHECRRRCGQQQRGTGRFDVVHQGPPSLKNLGGLNISHGLDLANPLHTYSCSAPRVAGEIRGIPRLRATAVEVGWGGRVARRARGG